MSSFYCEHCGKPCIDSPKGYVTGCEHYPADVELTKEVAAALAVKAAKQRLAEAEEQKRPATDERGE